MDCRYICLFMYVMDPHRADGLKQITVETRSQSHNSRSMLLLVSDPYVLL